ncbi:hypothetical protein AB6831_04370 [Carnobacterium divergens]|uniref:hypothetical protein n=1 Tax=Carnobacterium divergens TaxID=2748 RepID=UPI0039C97188
MVYTKQKWVEYNENLSEQQNIEAGAVVTSNKLNYIESGINTESKKVSDIETTLKNLSYYTQMEVDEMLIKLIAGEKISATFTMDFKNKVAGSLVENPNVMKLTTSQDMPIPSDSRWAETTTTVYIQTGTLGDNKIATASALVALSSRKFLVSFKILEDFKRKFPCLSVTLDLLKKYVTGLEVSAYAKGSNGAGNFCQINNYYDRWIGGNIASNKTNELKKISLPIIVPKNYILADGTVTSLISSKESDGKTASSLSVDYVSLEYTVELSLRDIFVTKEELSGHTSNSNNPHKVTKTHVGLGAVDNLQQATKTEFNAHTSNKSNPHGVTASQTGAYTKKETDDLLNKKLNIQTPSAWVNLPLVSGYTTAERNTPMYRIAPQFDGSRKVEFKGQVKKTSGQFPANAPSQFATIPAFAKPKTNIFYHGGTNTAVGGRLVAENNGNIQLLTSVATDYVVLDVLTYTL